MDPFTRGGCLAALSLLLAGLAPAEQVLLERPLHRRNGDAREWDSFAEAPPGQTWESTFDAEDPAGEATLRVRQEDVKQVWKVRLNDRELGRLVRDENPMFVHFAVPQDLLRETGNRLRIEPGSQDAVSADDVRIGPVSLLPGAREQRLAEATLQVVVLDENDGPLPCRFTLTGLDGTLIETGAESGARLAVRPGCVYSIDGRAEVPVPPGEYFLYAGRGFEYSLVRRQLSIAPGDRRTVRLSLRREVSTPGYVACDTHVHSRTHSGHGDATVQERMITLAGEGIELPVATDHNVNIDHQPFARELGADRYFTPVIGNEVTTKWGHFNVFPIAPSAAPPDHRGDNWQQIFGAIDGTEGVKAVVLNHARDLHGGYRPFGPAAFNDAVGKNLQGWRLRANAMEVLNSSATQTDVRLLLRDWMTLLNYGLPVTPVGSSDSHDVARHFVGQGRTYIRCDDREAGAIDVAAAVESFVAGRVRVSYGLLAELWVEDRWTSGETARIAGQKMIDVRIVVRGPHWVAADRVELYANGELVQAETVLDSDRSAGVVSEKRWKIPNPGHDQHLVAVAVGPGIEKPYWRTAKPYQPDSPAWTPRLLGCSGAVWLDGDGDGRRQSARDYALSAVARGRGVIAATAKRLGAYDAATAAQAVSLLHELGHDPLSDGVAGPLTSGSEAVRDGYRRYVEAWRRSEMARAGR